MSNISQTLRRITTITGWIIGTSALFCIGIATFISLYAREYTISPNTDIQVRTAIVLGAAVYKGEILSDTMRDRMDTAIELYQNGTVRELFISHSEQNNTNTSINTMAEYAIKNGVAEEALRLDIYGYNTRATMRNAFQKFGIENAIIVTQDYHLPRAIYLARAYDINAYGISASKRYYLAEEYFTIREWFARIKDFILIFLEHLGLYRV